MRIANLIHNFRTGLIGLLPAVDHVGIPWQRPDAYDEWDNMMNAIYNALVFEPIRCGLPEIDAEAFRLAPYDLLLPSYTGVSALEVLPPTLTGALRIFHALGTTHDPFDTVEWRSVSLQGSPQSDVLFTSPLETIGFRLRLVGPGGAIRLFDEINVPNKDA